MEQLTRRSFCRNSLASVITYSLLESIWQAEAFGDEVKSLVSKWVTDVNTLGRDVKAQNVSQILWQEKIEELFAEVNLEDLLKAVDFDKLTKNVAVPDKGAKSLRFEFPAVNGESQKLVFGKQIFALKKGRSVVPHGHNNMATAFLMLRGTLHGRHYDRLEDESDHIIIRPTIDRSFSPGECSSVSDYKDNIHWFKAESDVAYIFNIHVLDTRPDSNVKTGRVYLNPNGEPLSGGLIRAPRIGYTEATKLFG